MTRIAFVTGHLFGQRALEGLLSSDAALDGRLECGLMIGLPEGRAKHTVGYSSLRELADAYRVPFEEAVEGTVAGNIASIERVAPHFLLVIGWSRLIPANVLDVPRRAWGAEGEARNQPSFGCIGIHPTCLPEGRGQAPIPWTILKDCKRSALTTFFLEDAADSGAVIRQDHFAVRPKETATTMFHRVADLHFHAGQALAEPLARREVASRLQDDAVASVWPRRRPEDSQITNFSSAHVERMVRALAWPYPRAFVKLDTDTLRVTATRRRDRGTIDGEVGEVLGIERGVMTVLLSDAVMELELDADDVSSVGADAVGRVLDR